MFTPFGHNLATVVGHMSVAVNTVGKSLFCCEQKPDITVFPRSDVLTMP
jgi:hypothetical protein